MTAPQPLDVDEQADKILVQMVYTIMRYDPDGDIMEEDREAVNVAKAKLHHWATQERISEIKKVITDTLSPETVGGHFIHDEVAEFARQQKTFLEERIAELEATLKGEEEPDNNNSYFEDYDQLMDKTQETE